MKHLLSLTLLFTIFFIACSEDDDNPNDGSDPIIGIWELTEDLENTTSIINDCEKKSWIQFTNDGKFNSEYYYLSGTDTCEKETESSSWENIGDGTYIIDDFTETPVFSANNTVMSIIEKDGDDTYTSVFTKR